MDCQQKFTKQGFGEKRHKDDNLSLYCSWCSENYAPYITIRKKAKYCLIEIDLIFTKKYLSLPAQEKIRSIFKNNCPEEFEKYSVDVFRFR